MSCSGGLTGLMLTAAGGMVTNGSLPDTFGGAPFSSLSGAPLSLTDSLTGLTNFAPTLSTMVSGLAAISGAGAPLAGLGAALSAINGAGFTSNMLGAFNAIPTDLGSNGGLFDAIGGFAPSVNNLLTDVTGGSGVLNDALKYAGDWSAQTLGGSFAGIGGAVTGDPKKFGTILNTASSYVSNANQMINAATNSTALGNTFTGMDNIVSGGVAGVNLDFGGFGEEISKLGATVDFGALENLGSPGQLLANMSNQGTLGPLYDKISNIEVDSRTAQVLGGAVGNADADNIKIGDLGVDLNTVAQQGAGLPAGVQQQIYAQLESLDAVEVAQVKSILKNSQDAVVNGSDLVDPKKLLPNSFQTLTAPLRTASVGFRAIYENSSGSVNSQFDSLGNNLKGIVPDDVAVANGAFSRSLQQIKNIAQTDSENFGTSVNSMESLKDLDLLENQSEYVTESVRNYWIDNYGEDSTYNVTVATGNAGQLKLSDVIGFAAGFNSAAPITKNAQLLAEMQASGELDDIVGNKGIYDTIEKFCAGDFTTCISFGADPETGAPVCEEYRIQIPSDYVGGPVTQTGSNLTDLQESVWVDHIVPDIKIILASFTANSRAVEIMANSERWNQQLAREYLNQQRADNEDLTVIRASDDVAINLAINLPTLGQDDSEGGTAEILERTVDFSSLGGQATIAAMREGRNLARLGDANIQRDAPIDFTGVEDPATLLSASYTAQEAKNRLIKS